MDSSKADVEMSDIKVADAEQGDVEQGDVEKSYATRQVVAKLRRLADALESGTTFSIQIAGQRIAVPPYATVEFEYERNGDTEEIEIELTWKTRN